MKTFLLLIVVLAIGGYIYAQGGFANLTAKLNPSNNAVVTQGEQKTETSQPSAEALATVATGLDTPWAIAVLPDGGLLVTERPGRVRFVDKDGVLAQEPSATLPGVKEVGEGGLLGIALDPAFMVNKYVYLYYTYTGGANSLNRVVRMTYNESGHALSGETTVLEGIPGNSNHNGGRIKFGPDGYLYVGTGDAQEPSLAQDTSAKGGKILRMTTDGKPAPGNPFDNYTYSYGHRNVQGLAWDGGGALWATEHGRSGVQSGLDELNLIQAGKNYGWPTIEGDKKQDGMETARRNSGGTTWAPSGAAFIGNSLYFSGLRGKTLYEAVVNNGQVTEVREHLKGQYGRIREVVAGPNDMLYITTSNQDGRGDPAAQDDQVILVDPAKL